MRRDEENDLWVFLKGERTHFHSGLKKTTKRNESYHTTLQSSAASEGGLQTEG